MVKIKIKGIIFFICILAIVTYITSPIITKAQANNRTSSINVPVVVIDPGHGGYDSGAIGFSGLQEKNVTLQVALRLGKLLQNQGVKVVYTRTSDNVNWPSNQLSDLNARAQISNTANADYYISIHCNYVNNRNIDGTETYYYGGSVPGKRLAESVQNELIKSTKLPDRGIKKADYFVLKYTNAPAILTELGFISNEKEENNLNDPIYQDKLANALYTGFMKVINNNSHKLYPAAPSMETY